MNKKLRLIAAILFCIFLNQVDAQVIVTLGTGAQQNTTTTYPTPYGNWYTSAKQQYLILASELTAAGASVGFLNSVAFDVVTPNGVALNDFTIKIDTTSLNDLVNNTSAFLPVNNTVFGPINYTETASWNLHTFTTPYFWDGVSNLIVEVCFSNGTNNYTFNAVVNTSPTTYVSTIINRNDTDPNTCSNSQTQGFPNNFNERPDMRFEYIPANGIDIGVSGLLNPSGPVAPSSTVPISIEVKSIGSTLVNTATVGYQLNNGPIITETWNGNLGQFQTSSHTFTTQATFSPSGPQLLKFWATTPNGTYPDLVPSNDTMTRTICFAIPAGTYTVGTPTSDYPTIQSVLDALSCGGILGPVVFEIANGTYIGTYTLGEIQGVSVSNTVTFISQSQGGVVLKTNSNGDDIFKLSNSDYVTFKNLSFVRNIIGAGSKGDINAERGSDFLSVINCTFFDSTTNTFNSNRALGVTNSNNATIRKNTFNGYNAQIIFSNLDIAYGEMHVVDSNNFNNFYNNSVTATNQYQLQITHNHFFNNSSVNFGGSGVNGSGFMALMIANNFFTGKIGIDAIAVSDVNDTLGTPNSIINNVISGTNDQFTFRGILVNLDADTALASFNRLDKVLIANNTIRLLVTGSSTSTTNAGINISEVPFISPGYGLATSVVVKNNNIVVEGTSVPSAFSAYFIEEITTKDSLYSRNNNFYNPSNQNVVNYNGTQISLNDWQTLEERDTASVSLDPLFVSSALSIPSDAAFNNLGIALPEVTTDVLGTVRGAIPDLGAYEFTPLPNDVGVQLFRSPASGCGLSANSTVRIRVRNFGTDPATGFTVYYSINNGTPISQIVNTTVLSGDTLLVSFTVPANLAAPGTYAFKAWTTYNGDTNLLNDTAADYPVVSIPTITTYPYIQDFESGNGGWTSGGTLSSWQMGTPAKTNINTAPAPGSNVWMTGLSAQYNNNERSFVMGPCFDFSSMLVPRIKFDIYWDVEQNWDGAALQYSTNQGATWTTLGTANSILGTNWYSSSIMSSPPVLTYMGNSNWWSGAFFNIGSKQWVKAEHPLVGLGGQSSVLLRFAFASDGGGINDGVAFDNIEIYQPVDPNCDTVSKVAATCAPTSKTVTSTILKFAGLQNVRLYYDLNNSGSYSFVNMSRTQIISANYEVWTGTIPISNPGVQVNWFVYAQDSTGRFDSSKIYNYTDAYITANAGPNQVISSGGSATIGTGSSQVQGIVVSEIMFNRGGTGTQTSFPAYLPQSGFADMMEITNTAPYPINLNGLVFRVYSTSAMVATYNLSNITLPANTPMVLIGGAGTDSPQDYMFYINNASADFMFSGGAFGFVVVDTVNNKIIDAAAYGGSYAFPSAAGVTAADWTGFVSGTSGRSGIQRTGTDNNLATDFQINSAALFSTVGTINVGLVSGGANYAWRVLGNATIIGNTPQISVSPSLSTTYVITVSDGVCTSRDTVTVIVLGTTTDISVSKFIKPAANALVNGFTPIEIDVKNVGNTIMQYFDVSITANGNPITTGTFLNQMLPLEEKPLLITPAWIPNDPGVVRLCAYPSGVMNDANRANDTACQNITTTVSVRDLSNTSGLVTKAYPNPTSDVLNLEINADGEAVTIEITDQFGRTVQKINLGDGVLRRIVVLDAQSLAAGFYAYRVTAGSKFQAGKFVVKK